MAPKPSKTAPTLTEMQNAQNASDQSKTATETVEKALTPEQDEEATLRKAFNDQITALREKKAGDIVRKHVDALLKELDERFGRSVLYVSVRAERERGKRGTANAGQFTGKTDVTFNTRLGPKPGETEETETETEKAN